jgi:hypothetical protein
MVATSVSPDSQFVQALLAQLPWWDNMLLLEKLKDRETGEWYAQEVIKKWMEWQCANGSSCNCLTTVK